MTRSAAFLATAALTLAALTAAGASPAAADSAYQAFGARGRAQDVRRTIDVVMRDNAFAPQRIQIRAGETVRFRLRNEGQLLHEFNIGTAAMHVQHQRDMQMMFDHGMMTATAMTGTATMDHARMRHGSMPMRHDDPNAILVEPGQAGELVFRFTRAAELEFACNVPGHYQAGMVGRVVFSR